MISNKFILAVSLISVHLFSGCAILLSGGIKPRQFYVSSNVKGAHVLNVDGRKEYGTSPVKVSSRTASKPITILLEKDNYAPVQHIMDVQNTGGFFLFLDAMLLCIPCIPDAKMGAFHKFEYDSLYLPMKRIREKDKIPVPIVINNLQWMIKEGEEIGKIGKEKLYFKKNNMESRQYIEFICDEFEETRYETKECGEEKSSDKYNNKRYSNIQLTPSVKKLNLQSIKRNHTYKMVGKLTIDWIFTTAYNDTLYVFSDAQSAIINTSEKRKSISALLGSSLYKLLDDDKTFDIINDIAKNKKITQKLSISPIALKRPSSPLSTNGINSTIKYLVKSVVTIEHKNGHGSGFIVSEDGYILTNYHVIHGNTDLDIKLNESITLKATIVRTNPEYDLALLKINAEDLQPLLLGNSDSLDVGDEVIAIGTPEDISLGQSVSKGIVSGKRKFEGQVFIQTDVSVNPGNSGGPLINLKGEVIGIVSRKLVGKGIEGIAFGIPILVALEKLNILVDEK